MLTKIEIPKYICGTPISVKFKNIKHEEAHYHPEAIEFLYCFSGRGKIKIDNELHAFSAGNILLIEHENIHAIFSEEDNLIMSLHIDLKQTQYEWEKIRYYYYACMTQYNSGHEGLKKVENLLLCVAFLYVTNQIELKLRSKDICENLTRLMISNFSYFTVNDLLLEDNVKYTHRLNNVLTYIQKHYTEKITLNEISKNENINANYFSQFLKRTPFQSFTQLLNYVRCFNAEHMILNTDYTIEEISNCCGFSSNKYFHRYFKRLWKSTPNQFRNWFIQYGKAPKNVLLYEPSELNGVIDIYCLNRVIEGVIKNASDSM